MSIPAERGHSETLSLLQEGLLREEQSGICCYSFLTIITWMLSIEGSNGDITAMCFCEKDVLQVSEHFPGLS